MPLRVDREKLSTAEQVKAKEVFETKLRNAADDRLAEELVRYVSDTPEGAMPPDRILAQVLTSRVASAQDIDLASLVRLLSNEGSVVRGVAAQTLRKLASQEAQKPWVIEALWHFLEGSDLVDPVDKAFELIVELEGDPKGVFDRLVADERILDWQRGSLLTYHLPMSQLLERTWPASPQESRIESLILAAVRYEQHPGVVDAMAKWLCATPKNIRFSGASEKVLLKTLTAYLEDDAFLAKVGAWQSYREQNLFLAVDHLGRQDALDVLPPARLGRFLLLYSPGRLDEWWSKENTQYRKSHF